jgi:Methane oxygenase PmoA
LVHPNFRTGIVRLPDLEQDHFQSPRAEAMLMSHQSRLVDSPLSIHHTFGRHIEVDSAVGRATYRHDAAQPKPCIHPLTTPSGATLTGFEMSDHVWHRGLWFTIKFINGENFWEENAPFGVQRSTAEPSVQLVSTGEAIVRHDQRWTSDKTGDVFVEQRTIRFVDQPEGVRQIDWTSILEAQQDLTLDRTPYTTWGGYSGLTFRTSREFHGATFTTPGGGTSQSLLGDRHEWALLQGKLDGGRDRTAAIGIIEHPDNPRATTPWYGKCADGYVFFNAAFLFHEPMQVKKHETLTFRYRVLTRDGHWTHDAFAALAAEFRGGTK